MKKLKDKQTASRCKKSAAYRALEKKMLKLMIRIFKAKGIPIPSLPKEKSK